MNTGIHSNSYNNEHKNVVTVTHVTTTVLNVIYIFRLTEPKFPNFPDEESGIKFVVSQATSRKKTCPW